MKKQHISLKRMLILSMALGCGLGLRAQLTETMGTVGSATEAITTHETNNRFDLDNLTYSGVGSDLRNNTPSPVSGGYNVLIQAQENFQMQVINAAKCDTADSLIFYVFKSINASNGSDFKVEFSNDNGGSWNNLPFAPLPTGTGTSHWYRRGNTLPATAHVSNLWLRFSNTLVGTSSSNPQFRLDDITLTCGSDSPCGPDSTTILVSGPTTYCSGTLLTDLTALTSMGSPSFQWYDQNGPIAGEVTDTYSPTVSGSYYVVVSNPNGCQSTSEKVVIYVYPQPTYCKAEIEGCSGDTLQVCVQVDAHDLFFSQYVEGTGFNKYLEIYNGTCNEVDLSHYVIRAFHNGAPAASPTYTIALSGMLASGSAYVVANPDANVWSGTPDLTSANIQFNGDDALVLFNTSTGQPADVFGSVGHDPGSSWRNASGISTENKTLVRKSYVYSGVLTNPDLPGIGGFPYLFTEWDTLTVDDVTGLGSHAILASNYTFTVASGSATVVSASNNCVWVVPGTGTSTITIDGTFGRTDSCDEANNLITVTGNDCQERSAAVAGTRKAAETHAAALFPNPFTDGVTVSFSNRTAGQVTISLVDMYGQTLSVLSSSRMEAGAYQMPFDLSSLAAGTYICRIVTADGQETIRIIKSK